MFCFPWEEDVKSKCFSTPNLFWHWAIVSLETFFTFILKFNLKIIKYSKLYGIRNVGKSKSKLSLPVWWVHMMYGTKSIVKIYKNKLFEDALPKIFTTYRTFTYMYVSMKCIETVFLFICFFLCLTRALYTSARPAYKSLKELNRCTHIKYDTHFIHGAQTLSSLDYNTTL